MLANAIAFSVILCKYETYSKPLVVICWRSREKCIERVVCWQCEASGVYEEFSGDIEEDEEEVECAEPEDYVDFGDAGLLLKVIESWVFRQFPLQQRVSARKTRVVRERSVYLSRLERWYCALLQLIISDLYPY